MFSMGVRHRTSKDAADAVRRGKRRMLMDLADRGFAKSQEEAPVDTGQLQQSGVPPTELDDGSVVWGYNADYARPVEEGSEPHWPPIEPLRGWARRVLGDESAAYAVQAKIAAKGTPAQPFVAPAIDVMRARARAKGLDAYIREEL